MALVEVNLLAVLVAAVLNMLIGALWYSPLLFAERWMALAGKTPDGLRGSMIRGYVLSFVGALVMALVLAQVITLMQARLLLEGILVGFLVWLGFVVTTSSTTVLFEGRSLELHAINSGYQLAALIVMGGLLAVWV